MNLVQVKFYESKLEWEIDAWDTFDALKQGSVQVIDVRSKELYEREHIPGEISFPYRDITLQTAIKLDPQIRYVVYCDGEGCNASTKGATRLARLGYSVQEMIGGLEWWIREGYSTVGVLGKDGKNF